jgi:hypothetical protein
MPHKADVAAWSTSAARWRAARAVNCVVNREGTLRGDQHRRCRVPGLAGPRRGLRSRPGSAAWSSGPEGRPGPWCWPWPDAGAAEVTVVNRTAARAADVAALAGRAGRVGRRRSESEAGRAADLVVNATPWAWRDRRRGGQWLVAPPSAPRGAGRGRSRLRPPADAVAGGRGRRRRARSVDGLGCWCTRRRRSWSCGRVEPAPVDRHVAGGERRRLTRTPGRARRARAADGWRAVRPRRPQGDALRSGRRSPLRAGPG